MTSNEQITPYIKIGSGFSYNKSSNFYRPILPDPLNSSPRAFTIPGINNWTWSYKVGFGIIFKENQTTFVSVDYSFIKRGKAWAENYLIPNFNNTISFRSSKTFARIVDSVLSISVQHRF